MRGFPELRRSLNRRDTQGNCEAGPVRAICVPITFRLYADPSIRTLQLKRDLPGVSQKMLTAHLREMARDGLIERVDLGEKPLRVEYQLSETGRQLLPVLIAARRFSTGHLPAADDSTEDV
ncbi:helix-turn-helix domain-containing protein [Pseudomonas sp. SJZ131]|uniref:winged helix-turn-helix transcriptional regulator n=1 Tax=Pseudomonas sp. SJZ131 TaxID=2572895 RepID=UPI00119A3A95|nr:helix-turn-helix domain-containing protein [Pseudomonas sp. SJZ131]TWD50302.1 HxlR family transcriptional regulator [Pseudomonas sp. SJZ131]